MRPPCRWTRCRLSRHYRCYPGQGDYPIADYLEAIAKTGYRGPVSLEIFNDQFRGASANAIALDGMRSLRALGETVNAARAGRGEPPLPDLPALPPAPEVKSVEFIEFATGDDDAGALVGLIEGLGLQAHRPAPLQGRRVVPPGRDQHRHQPGSRGFCTCFQ